MFHEQINCIEVILFDVLLHHQSLVVLFPEPILQEDEQLFFSVDAGFLMIANHSIAHVVKPPETFMYVVKLLEFDT